MKKIIIGLLFVYCLTESVIVYAACINGHKEYSASGCSYKQRTCCPNQTWGNLVYPSEGSGCADSQSCLPSQCYVLEDNGDYDCQNKGPLSGNCSQYVPNSISGTATRTATCVSGSGWQYSVWNDNNCICKPGYVLSEETGGGCIQKVYNCTFVRFQNISPNTKSGCEDDALGDIHVYLNWAGYSNSEYLFGGKCYQSPAGPNYYVWRSGRCEYYNCTCQ